MKTNNSKLEIAVWKEVLKKYDLTDCFKNEAAIYPQYALARVTAQYRGLYKVITENSEGTASCRKY